MQIEYGQCNYQRFNTLNRFFGNLATVDIQPTALLAANASEGVIDISESTFKANLNLHLKSRVQSRKATYL